MEIVLESSDISLHPSGGRKCTEYGKSNCRVEDECENLEAAINLGVDL